MTAGPAAPQVAFLVKRFPRLSETFVQNEFLELRRQGLPLRLLALMDPEEAHVQPEAASLAAEVTYLRGRRWLPLIPRLLVVASRRPAGTARALRWVLPRGRLASWRRLAEALVLVDELGDGPVHLHVHWAHAPAATALLAERISGVTWSLTAHAKDIYTVPAEDVAERCRRAAFVATCTEANVRHLVDEIGVEDAKVVLCRHGVDLDRFDGAQRHPQPGRILAVGRLVPKKGFEALVLAVADLRDRGLDVRLDLVGEGPQRAAIEALVASHRLQGIVELHGALPQPELVGFYRRAAVFALAPAVQSDGDRDGVPNVILEAMASGVPVVATAISGIPEVIDDRRTGLLVPPGDPAALADALAELLADPEAAAALGAAGAASVRASFDLPGCVAPVRDLLRRCLAQMEPVGP